MRNQDKGLLTTSTRLLNAQVKKAELRADIEGNESDMARTDNKFSKGTTGTGGPKAISTIDLLRKQKEVHRKMRHLSQSSGERDDSIGDEDGKPTHTLQNAFSMPVLRTLNDPKGALGNLKTEGPNNDQALTEQGDMYMLSHRDPVVNRLNRGEPGAIPNRPSSTVLMQLGDKEHKKMIKKKFDLANARQRDPTKALGHSYQSKL